MAFKNVLRRAANLVVELPPEESVSSAPKTDAGAVSASMESSREQRAPASQPVAQTKTVEQIVAEAPGPNLDQIQVQAEAGPAPAPGGAVDFAHVYTRANLVASKFTAEQAMDMINSLPAELPIEVKRQTVLVTMQAMGKATGVDINAVVADAASKLAALESYSDSLQTQTAEYLAQTQLEITQLENSISEKRKEIENTKSMLSKALEGCRGEIDRLDDVLEFFSKDVAPSKLAGS